MDNQPVREALSQAEIDAKNEAFLPVLEGMAKLDNLLFGEFRYVDKEQIPTRIDNLLDQITDSSVIGNNNFAFYCFHQLGVLADFIQVEYKLYSTILDAVINREATAFSLAMQSMSPAPSQAVKAQLFRDTIEKKFAPHILDEVEDKIRELSAPPDRIEAFCAALNPKFVLRVNYMNGSMEQPLCDHHDYIFHEKTGLVVLDQLHDVDSIIDDFVNKFGEAYLPSQPILDRCIEAVVALLPYMYLRADRIFALHSDRDKAYNIYKDAWNKRAPWPAVMSTIPLYSASPSNSSTDSSTSTASTSYRPPQRSQSLAEKIQIFFINILLGALGLFVVAFAGFSLYCFRSAGLISDLVWTIGLLIAFFLICRKIVDNVIMVISFRDLKIPAIATLVAALVIFILSSIEAYGSTILDSLM